MTANEKQLESQIPEGCVMLLYWVRRDSDSRDTASSVGHKTIPARGCMAAARELDLHGDRDLGVVAGHGVTVLWPSSHMREIRGFE